MTSIRTVNLLWEQKVRGSYPVSRFGLDDEGTVTLAMPRPLAARTYDLTRFRPDNAVEVRTGFSVETLLKLEASGQSDAMVGMTGDDIYLLVDGAKSRFLNEKRILFVDTALSADGQTLAAGFSDMAGSSFALAVGDVSGRVHWLQEAEGNISSVTISPEGKFIAQGEDAGTCRMFDISRREHWIFEQPEPVRALACALQGRYTAYGTAEGSVGLIDGEGSRKWEARLPGEVVSLALSADGGLCAVLCRPVPDEGTARIYCLVGAGQVGWEYEAEKRLLSLALSPNGKYLATSSRDGTHTIYEVIYGESSVTGSSLSLEDAQRKAEACRCNGDWEGAYRTLRPAVLTNLTAAEAAEQLDQIRQALRDQKLTEAKQCCNDNQFASAVAILETLRDLMPEEPVLYAHLHDFKTRRAMQLEEEAVALAQAGRFSDAETALREALAVNPFSLPARRELASLGSRRASEADAQAERLLAQGEIESGLAALERAQEAAASAERAEKIRRAQIAMEFADGMKAYSEKRYKEAVFQFKKVLARDPGHADARRHLAFAERFDEDSNEALNDRFSRLE